jgi:phosphatidylglycerophosphate synthase
MLANILTGIRLLLIAPLVVLISSPQDYASYLLLLVLLVAIASDYFDGIVARKFQTASPKGQLFDHGTDFLFVTSGLFAAASQGLITLWLPTLIVIAFSQYVLDSYFLYRQKQLRMSVLGRWNGIFYFAPLLLIASANALPFESGIALPVLAVLGWLLVLSTLVSIADRALAPIRPAMKTLNPRN